MSYTALYRKWRSRNFDEVKGQEAVTESFRNQIRSGRIGHAYLFCGTRGTGKTSVAKILARAVNCTNPQNGNPCNACPSCLSILNESSMNVIEMDAASNNGVDDIRQIREQVAYPPVDAKYKVYIIDEVHMLSTSAFNAFLKTLEEPPDYVVFVLATTEPNKIPITILSRCQRYDFKRIATSTIAERLKEIAAAEKIDISDDALFYIARIGDGSMRDSVSLLDQCATFLFDRHIAYEDALDVLGAVDTGVFSDLVRALSQRNIRRVLELVAEMVEQGRELSQFTSDFLHYVRDMLMARTVQDLGGLVEMSAENLARLREDSAMLSMDELLRYIRMLSELLNQLRYATQKRILIETTLMKLAYPETDATPEGMFARIGELERRLEGLGRTISDLPAMPREMSAFPMGQGGISISGTQGASPSIRMGEESAQGQFPAAAVNETSAEASSAALVSGGTSPAASKAMPSGKSQTNEKNAGGKAVSIPRAQYDDFQTLRKEWGKIAVQMPHGLLQSALRKSTVHPDPKSKGMVIAVEDKASYNILSEKEKLDEIRQFLSEQYGKDVALRVELLRDETTRNTVYVTDEDLKQIHFPVEVVDEVEKFL